MTFIIGQRWISNTESQLGLGVISESTGRQVSIQFPAADELRIYAKDNAPLSRVVFKEGEEILTIDHQKLVLTEIKEIDGLILYSGVDEDGNHLSVKETELSCFIQLHSPEQRLFNGLLDKLSSFKLRIDTLNHLSRLQQSKIRGLLGARTNHLPHQIYIASEVAQRHAPRVLLADEVGLGKTIEAGMIIHHQILTGRAQRVLIVVPSSLLHQWLVEMIRRFNLYFSLFDEHRMLENRNDYEDEETDNEPIEATENFFESQQLVLCSLDFLMENEEARNQATALNWDLLVVDEAHRLHWSEENVSSEYLVIEKLAHQSAGLLLLTATPEQAGIESHFARLRLLDPSRFHHLKSFKKEEDNYQKVNQLVQELLDFQSKNLNQPLSNDLQKKLKKLLGQIPANTHDIISKLLDQHGTGRVLFRNTRAAIQGFPARVLHCYPLPCPTLYVESNTESISECLYLEQTVTQKEWLQHDPRVELLASLLKSLKPKKILVICAVQQSAIALEEHFNLIVGVRCAAFHEGLSIIERDRAAAYFSEQDNGAQVLFCSEIGSEGRNFQFAHHLFLFDLPINPDLLEQRIGRLDRIGQQHDINIHVPYLINTGQEVLFRWYHEGIQLFQNSCSVAYSIYEAFENTLLSLLQNPQQNQENPHMQQLIKDTSARTEQLRIALSEGRDMLLELNSCNIPVAQSLIDAIETEENSDILDEYMNKVFHEYGIDSEYHSERTEILHPSDHMKTSHFPGLKEDGLTITFSREKALIREDIEFLSWEHPMVSESMEMILCSELGNATLCTISVKSINPGTLFLESFYTINCSAPKSLQLDRFLPLTPFRVLMDITGKNLAKVLSYQQLNDLCEPVKRHLGHSIIAQIRDDLDSILKKSLVLVEKEMAQIKSIAKESMRHQLENELNRLIELRKINPSIRVEEIDFLTKQIVDSGYYIENSLLKIQALRVVINK